WKTDAICHAVSPDGLYFEKDPTNPVFRPTDDWCSGRAIDADVCIFGDKLFLYFATRDHEMKIQKLGAASAPADSGFHREDFTQCAAETILEPTLPWEGECIEAPATMVYENKVYMFYAGAYNCWPQQIGVATSEDGIHFTRMFDKPLVKPGNAEAWNASESGHPYIFEDPATGKVFLYYQGSPDKGKTWYLSRREVSFSHGYPVVAPGMKVTEEDRLMPRPTPIDIPPVPAKEKKIWRTAWMIAAVPMTTERQFAEVAEAGFNMIILTRPAGEEMLANYCAWMEKYGLKALWYDGKLRVGGYTGEMDEYVFSPVTWGHMLCDEPTAAKFPELAEMYKDYTAKAPGKVAFINLFPIYANMQQLGNKDYEEHLTQFFDTVHPDYLSVDVYPMDRDSVGSYYFDNLDQFATACRNHGIPFAVYIQSVSFHHIKRLPTGADMRWQAWCVLSFGATNIEYFTYRTPDSDAEVFLPALIDRDNTKTDRWYAAKEINEEIAAMEDAFLGYRNLGAFTHKGEEAGAYAQFAGQYRDFAVLEEIRSDTPLLIGAFAAEEGDGYAFTAVNLTDPGEDALPAAASFRLADGCEAVLWQKGVRTPLTTDADGFVQITLDCGEGVFVEVKCKK
ncbi:MAG: beta-galactosidase, partial [Clostridia bacterium]|nr:beta-galactosidase [Clostridia bacterium]